MALARLTHLGEMNIDYYSWAVTMQGTTMIEYLCFPCKFGQFEKSEKEARILKVLLQSNGVHF